MSDLQTVWSYIIICCRKSMLFTVRSYVVVCVMLSLCWLSDPIIICNSMSVLLTVTLKEMISQAD